MPLVLAALLLPVVAYCSLRALAPRLGTRLGGGTDVAHRRDTDVWHVLMGVAMAAMLLGALTRPLAVAALVVCAAGLGWGVLSVERRSGGGAPVRLMVGAGAMAVMTLPMAAPAMAADGSQMAGMSGMTGPSPMPLVLALLVGLLGVAAVRLPSAVRRSPGAGAVVRLDAACDVVMAGTMAAMLLTLL